LRTTSVELTVLIDIGQITSNLIVEVNDFFLDATDFENRRNVTVKAQSPEETQNPTTTPIEFVPARLANDTSDVSGNLVEDKIVLLLLIDAIENRHSHSTSPY
jgi:hypothetical protein